MFYSRATARSARGQTSMQGPLTKRHSWAYRHTASTVLSFVSSSTAIIGVYFEEEIDTAVEMLSTCAILFIILRRQGFRPTFLQFTPGQYRIYLCLLPKHRRCHSCQKLFYASTLTFCYLINNLLYATILHLMNSRLARRLSYWTSFTGYIILSQHKKE